MPNRKWASLKLQGYLHLVLHKTAVRTQKGHIVHPWYHDHNSIRTRKNTTWIPREKACRLKLHVTQMFLSIIADFWTCSQHASDKPVIADTPVEWVAYTGQTMHCSFLAAKLVKRVRRVGKLYEEIAQKNPFIQHLPHRQPRRGKKRRKKEESN